MTLPIGNPNMGGMGHGAGGRGRPAIVRPSAPRPSPLAPVQGLTLVEVLVSVVLIAVGTVVVMQALAKVAQAQAIAEDRAQAYLIASTKMAEAELATMDGTPLSEHDGGHLRVNQQPFDWTLNATTSAEDAQVQAITLAVSWSRGQKTYRQEVSALVRLPQESP